MTMTDAHPGLIFTSLSFLLPRPCLMIRAPLRLVLLALQLAIPGSIDSLLYDVQVHIRCTLPQPFVWNDNAWIRPCSERHF